MSFNNFHLFLDIVILAYLNVFIFNNNFVCFIYNVFHIIFIVISN